MKTVLAKSTSNESIDVYKLVELPYMMDSEISTQVMKFMEPTSNKGTYQNVDNCNDNNTLVIDNKALPTLPKPFHACIQENLPEGHRIVDIATQNINNESIRESVESL